MVSTVSYKRRTNPAAAQYREITICWMICISTLTINDFSSLAASMLTALRRGETNLAQVDVLLTWAESRIDALHSAQPLRKRKSQRGEAGLERATEHGHVLFSPTRIKDIPGSTILGDTTVSSVLGQPPGTREKAREATLSRQK